MKEGLIRLDCTSSTAFWQDCNAASEHPCSTHACSGTQFDASNAKGKNATTMRRVAALIVGALAGTASAFQPARTSAPRAAPLQSIKINTRSGESVDSVIMRLRREVNKSGHLRTLRHKRFHEDAREKKKRKVAEARRKMKFMRQRKRRSQQQGP